MKTNKENQEKPFHNLRVYDQTKNSLQLNMKT